MQKALQRAKAARKTLEKRQAREAIRSDAADKLQGIQEGRRLRQLQGKRMMEAKKAYKENWRLGPLAPRRDVGEHAKSYGALTVGEVNTPNLPKDKRRQWWHIAEGDRVMLLKGRDRGKIGTVSDIHHDRDQVSVREMNKSLLKVPQWLRQEQNVSSEIIDHPLSMPVNDVRLVYPLPHPKTGVLRDVIIERLERVKLHLDRKDRETHVEKYGEDEDGTRKALRAIAGTHTIIPRPEAESEVVEEQADDTAEADVEEQTFEPLLYYPTIPLTAIDELRNKYSRMRTRHTEEYTEELQRRGDRADRRKKLIETMKTPLQELAELRARQKAASKKDLTKEQLAFIGRAMLQEQHKSGLSSRSQSPAIEA